MPPTASSSDFPRYILPRVGLESKGNTSNYQAAAEQIHRPLPSLSFGLLSRLDTPEPAAWGVELGTAALSSSGDGKGSHGRGLAGAADGAQGRNGMSDNGHSPNLELSTYLEIRRVVRRPQWFGSFEC